uniref:hypothetical protein n=2 Tax=Roseivirga sp. TaxID=1964215 RepID=UPI0040484FC1
MINLLHVQYGNSKDLMMSNIALVNENRERLRGACALVKKCWKLEDLQIGDLALVNEKKSAFQKSDYAFKKNM